VAVTLTIPGEPPRSRNDADKLHWGARQRERDAWKWLVHEAWARAGRPAVAGPVAVRFALVFRRGARRDLDNCVAACKPILDGLVDVGCIEDDSSRIVQRIEVSVAVDRERPRVEVEIAPVKVILRASEDGKRTETGPRAEG
jgi:Holliday junction resolvase RusA-like endonuclease